MKNRHIVGLMGLFVSLCFIDAEALHLSQIGGADIEMLTSDASTTDVIVHFLSSNDEYTPSDPLKSASRLLATNQESALRWADEIAARPDSGKSDIFLAAAIKSTATPSSFTPSIEYLKAQGLNLDTRPRQMKIFIFLSNVRRNGGVWPQLPVSSALRGQYVVGLTSDLSPTDLEMLEKDIQVRMADSALDGADRSFADLFFLLWVWTKPY